MKKVIGLIIGFLLTALLAIAGWFASEKIFESSQKTKNFTLVPKQKLNVPLGSTAYEIIDNEAIIQSEFIDRILIGRNITTITYRNKTDKPVLPNFKIRFFNVYGLMVASKKIAGTNSIEKNQTLSPGDVGSDIFELTTLPISEIFELSNIKLTENVAKIKWVVISDISNQQPAAETPTEEK